MVHTKSFGTSVYLAQAIFPDASGKFLGIGGLEFCFLKNFAILSISLLNVLIIRMYFSAKIPT